MDSNRLGNWVRALRWRPSLRHAMSLEGWYRPPRGVEVEYETGDPPPRPPQWVDPLDAWAVELAWRRCSAISRWVIKTHYHDALEPSKACRIIKSRTGTMLRVASWREYKRQARLELSKELGEFARAA